ncbi:aspartic proteinase asp1 [Phtheirospermum japonicum]|uniref:Aspartic proteinase asp1 n=1 Tax=Phtheirospermum japonicum TaxID=374723 RepID=A0A830B567_9LAMI|nr:aspartic proteinase asp1 [Phtheirospermum japonicum]
MHQKMYLKALVLYLLAWITGAYQPLNFSEMKPNSGRSTIFLPITGNVHPLGYYTVTISIGNPPAQFVLDVDTGSDLTWVPCKGSPTPSYDPKSGNIVFCNDPECLALGTLGRDVATVGQCTLPEEPCIYEAHYADGGSSKGVLVKNSFPFKFRNGKAIAPQLAFGCGNHKNDEHSIHQSLDHKGILGLGKGALGIIKQLSNMGAIRNVVGHCLSSYGRGGFLFLGDDFLPNSGIVWKQLLSPAEHYSLGSADLLFDGKATNTKDLKIIFDSGSTYTYLRSKAYGTLLGLINNILIGSPLKVVTQDNTLPLCWGVGKPFKFIGEVARYFKPLALSFTGVENVQFHIRPEYYLIISGHGNVCLGMLNGTEMGLQDMNVIGDISMQDKLVIYDNENGKIGWAAVSSCNRG